MAGVYGAGLMVRFEKRWCVGKVVRKVVGRERGKVMVKYADGIGIHSDLHTRGCRIRSCRRRMDLDKVYRVPLDEVPLRRTAGRVRVLAMQKQ